MALSATAAAERTAPYLPEIDAVCAADDDGGELSAFRAPLTRAAQSYGHSAATPSFLPGTREERHTRRRRLASSCATTRRPPRRGLQRRGSPGRRPALCGRRVHGRRIRRALGRALRLAG